MEGDPESGALVAVYASDGAFLAWGHYSPHSQIRVRLVSWDERLRPEGADFWRRRLRRAIDTRLLLQSEPGTDTYRLVHAESDYIPGLIVDRYADVLVAQFLSAGVEARRELFSDLLMELLQPTSLYERSDADVRQKEGLAPRTGLLRGTAPPEAVQVQENGLRFLVDVRGGHKSGFYLDQRENRLRLGDLTAKLGDIAAPPDLLNVFSYTGGFAAYALDAGANSAVNVDSSEEALGWGQQNLALNGLSGARSEDIAGDAFQVLRDLREAERHFDLIVLDPPKFAHSKRDVKRAARGYKDINLQALHLLRPGGHLFTFSCSGAISADLFQKIVFGAALDAGRPTQIIGEMMQSRDHPVALTFPEGAYLKGLVCRVLE